MKKENFISPIIGVVGILIAFISLIPSFLNLGRHEPLVYYTSSIQQISLPDGLDRASVLTLFMENNIPSGNMALTIINKGEGPAPSVNVRLKFPVHITQVKLTPSKSDKPVWVKIPDYELTTSDTDALLTQEFNNLAVGKQLNMNIWFQYLPPKVNDQENALKDMKPEVYFDGIKALPVASIEDAHQVIWFDHFKLPLTILGVSILVMIVIAILIRILSDPSFRSAFWKLFITDTFTEVFMLYGDTIASISKIILSRKDIEDKKKNNK